MDGSIAGEKPLLLKSDMRRVKCIAYFVMIQCLVIVTGAATVLQCEWDPQSASTWTELDLLARVMYLYDAEECQHSLKTVPINELKIDEDPKGFEVLLIARREPELTIPSLLANKTRRYLETTVALHVIWITATIFLLVLFCLQAINKLLKLYLKVYLIIFGLMVTFDAFMGIVHVTHISQALTREMVIRYSGWSVEYKVKYPDEFGGWIPLAASACWMRFIIGFILNIYCCKLIYRLLQRIQMKEYITELKLMTKNEPLPDSGYDHKIKNTTLYFRSGEPKPYIYNNSFSARSYF